VSYSSFPNDPLWPRASEWLGAPARAEGTVDLAIVGVPAHETSISPSDAHTTPTAVREALGRFSTYAGSRGVDVAELSIVDLGDIDGPDGPEGEARVRAKLRGALGTTALLVAIGGDNSITFPVMGALADDDLGAWGLITLDAHHDLRDGVSNGSPVRRLIEAGLPGANVVQVGIADFSNSRAYAERARDLGITMIGRGELRDGSVAEVAERALAIAGAGGRPVYVDLDVDVCDRSAAPGCPAAAPGGISADELRSFAFHLARDPRVRAVDITEVDAAADAPDGRTVRLAALLVLEAAAGLTARDAPV